MEQQHQPRRKRNRKAPLQTTPTEQQREKVEQIAAQFRVPTADVLRWAIDAFEPSIFFAIGSASETVPATQEAAPLVQSEAA